MRELRKVALLNIVAIAGIFIVAELVARSLEEPAVSTILAIGFDGARSV